MWTTEYLGSHTSGCTPDVESYVHSQPEASRIICTRHPEAHSALCQDPAGVSSSHPHSSTGEQAPVSTHLLRWGR